MSVNAYQRVKESKRKEDWNQQQRTQEEREIVLEIVCRHLNLYSLILDSNGTFKSPDTLHREYAAVMYTWCKIRGYYPLWAHMYSNWYRLDQYGNSGHDAQVLLRSLFLRQQ